ncbi:MAG: gliding motility-associated ABC transporter permease subunit GldF [Cyclobacteriaceae bacterium]|nr:gliding motility-associated ABC transporter permease subunit GldF [Cyclobacteriaceae bacterium]
MIEIIKKEFNSFLSSLIAYIVISVFLTGIGLFMWVFPETSILNYGYADMEALFSFGPYVLMFLIPAITMRSFSEEYKSGTIEWLLTKPLTDWNIILGKYAAGLLLVVFALIPTGVYYYSVYQLGNPVGNIDSPAVIGSYIGLLLLSAVFTSVGICASAMTRNQITSFVVAVFLSFILYSGLSSLAAINVWAEFSVFIEKIGIVYHYNALSRGLIDTRNVFYLLSLSTFMLLVTKLIIGSRKW